MNLRWTELVVDGDYAAPLLATLDPAGAEALVWYLRDLELAGQGLRGSNVLELEALISASPYGLRVTWSELVLLLRAAEDVRDLVVTGHRAATEEALDVASGRYPGCVAVVEVFDSGPYRVAWDDDLELG